MSKALKLKDSNNPIEKTFYIFLVFNKTKDANIKFKFSTNDAEQMLLEKENINGGVRYKSILKYAFLPNYPSQIVNLTFFNNEENFTVSFETARTFIFNPTLKIKKNKTANKKTILQNVIKITDKTDIFVKCIMEKEKDNTKIETLYGDCVNLLETNPDFELFIYLFIKLLEKSPNFKDIFKKLLYIFWDKTERKKNKNDKSKIKENKKEIEEIKENNNNKAKNKVNDENTKNKKSDNFLDKENENCKTFLDNIRNISSNSEKFISENSVDQTEFYGFILIYFNIYDFTQFKSLSARLQEKKENQKFFFDILIHYYYLFSNEINVNLEQYVDYLTGKDFDKLNDAGFVYFKFIEEFIHVVSTKKEKLVKMIDFKALKIPEQLKYNLTNPENFIKELEMILEFSINQKKLILFLSGTFWKKMTEVFEKPCADNIVYLFQLREKCKRYIQLVKEQYEKKDYIYSNAEDTEENDIIAIALNIIIRKNIEESKEISNDEIINQISKFDIYYIEDIYINRRDLDFLDKINFDDEENDWICNFKNSNFEDIFKNDIDNFIQKLISKIKKLEDLKKIIDMINENKIKEMNKMDNLIRALRKTTLKLLKSSELLKEPKKKDDKLSSLICLFELIYRNTKALDKIQDISERLDLEDKHKILIKLFKSFPGDESLQTYIFDFYINNINTYYKKINELFEILDGENIKNFLEKLCFPKEDKKKIISYEIFFNEKENLNLNLLFELSKIIVRIKETGYYNESKKVLKKIYTQIADKKLEIKNLATLISFKEENVKKRFELFNYFNMTMPKDKYENLKKEYEKAEMEKNELIKISDALKIFHKDFYINEIKKIEAKIANFEKGLIKEFSNISNLFNEIGDDIKRKADISRHFKDCAIFKKLILENSEKDQNEAFEAALEKLLEEYKKEKKEKNVSKKDEKIIKDFYKIKDDEQNQKDENTIGAEENIRNILYFCENFKLNSDKFEVDEEFDEFLSLTFEKIKKDISKKESLDILKEKGIYDCDDKKGVEFYNLFYGQKEAIDFLLTKTGNLDYIKDKILPIDNAIKANDIDEVNDCFNFFSNVLSNCHKKKELINKIGEIDQNLLDRFRKFIKIFPNLVEVDNNSDNSYNLYLQAKKYFDNVTYRINITCEEFTYNENGDKNEELDKIKSIKHKINIPNEIEIKLNENKDLLDKQGNSQEKLELLIKFKKFVNSIELIEQFISVFKRKGCSLPISIKIEVKNKEVEYFLDEKKISYEELKSYLLNVKNYLEKKLDLNYKTQENLRILYGEQFYTLRKNIFNKENIPSFLRYMINNLNDNIDIKEGEQSHEESTSNYVSEYRDFLDDSFKTYDKYISSVIKKNEEGIEELYEKMKIKYDSKDAKRYKGIYLYKSEQNSMEEDILNIFIDKTKNNPIAQNILISNKETSFEEMQAFFHRAFLCRFNTLFAIEINDSLSDVQLKIINNFISQLLKYQLNKYNNKIKKRKADIKETSKYIEPLIIFFYNVNKLNELFLNEINKYNPEEYPRIKDKSLNDFKNDTISSKKSQKSGKKEFKLYEILLKNTHIYSSEISGLGKTEKIKYKISCDNKEYIYFPLGGKLSRDIIFKKLEEILKKFKAKNAVKTAIHLDLYETEDTSILNEFLFSFCFTKFYANNKNVLYIPLNTEIYIEIPNCFNNFIDNYPILKHFEMNRIQFKNRDKLRLDEEKTKFFNWMIPEKNIEGKIIKQDPEEYIISHIIAMGAKTISYHQINIFIKLFMSQYKIENPNNKLKFTDNGEDVTEDCIEEFARCVKYFILGVYAKLLTKSLNEEDCNATKNDTMKSIENINRKSDENDSENYKNSNNNIDVYSFDEIDVKDMNSDSIHKEFFNINEINEIDINKNISMDKKDNNNKNYEELRKDYIKKLSLLYDYDLKNEKYESPIIFIIKNSIYYKEIYLSDEKLEGKKPLDFLSIIKDVLNLNNPVKKTINSNLKSLKEIIEKDNYVITKDNFRKMILFLYRLLADIPVILMGETGCGKTGLIRKLYQLLNDGEDMNQEKNMINVDSNINDDKLIKKMNDINGEARLKKGKDFWVLFDEINTCNSLGLLNEIFVNRSYGGIKIEDNIRLIGTCNPYRLKTEEEESCGLSHPFKNKNLAYDVNILPQSLMYFVFNFGYLSNNDEYMYIKSILTNHFNKDFHEDLIDIISQIISKCHIYLRELFGFSVVSLREIKRFIKLYDNLMIYYKNKDELDPEKKKLEKDVVKNEKNKIKDSKNKEKNEDNIEVSVEKKNLNQIQSLIITIYLSYYIRLIGQRKRTGFEAKILQNLKDLSNFYLKQDDNNEKKVDDKKPNFGNDLGIKWQPLFKVYNSFNSGNKENFSIFFENECNYVIDKIDLDKGIAKNRILKENIFLQFIAITANIPLIIIGKPGSSKSLSFQLLKKCMRGTYSKNEFFRKYPQLLSTYFQGSESTMGEDIDTLFKNGKSTLEKYKNCKENKPISLIVFDEIGLSEFAKDNPLKVLHKNLEYDGIKDGLSFVGFSNWKLDLSKLNRVLYLNVPDLDTQIDDLKDTAKCIAKSIREDNNIDYLLLKIICKSYQIYQAKVKKIKEYVVFKELEIQEMKEVLDILTKDEIKIYFKKDKKDITFRDFKNKRNDIETKKKYSWKYGKFADVKTMNEFKVLYSNNRSVNHEFHGNRDFYNYNKGVYSIKSISKNIENNDNNIGQQIEKVIERNFGGVDINLNIDCDENNNLELNYDDETLNVEEFNKMLDKCPNAKTKLKLPSVFLFKYIYNEELKNLDNSNIDKDNEIDDYSYKLHKYMINDDNLTKYDIIECINGNINDNDARFLLLEIEEGLKYLVYQNIISQNKDKIIKYMEGSPFINDIKDKNGEYKIKKISEIQNYCNKEMVLILSNLNQIYPFLYDFFNRNFIIKDDKKYGRICQGNFSEQLTYIHDKFRIIIMIDKNEIYKQESPFINRFEKAIVKFEELLNDEQKVSSKNINKELGTKELIANINVNYNISNLLINYEKTSIDRLYFFYSNQDIKQNKEEIKSKIYEKIARTLPQDIAIHLDDNHPIKSIYSQKNIFNLKDYIKMLNENQEKKKIYQFSIIYTFTPIFGHIEGINDIPQLMISEIKRENKLIDEINQKKFRNKANTNFFIIDFYQEESDKINFIITTLKNNYSDENIIFFFIIHIKRIMDKKNKQKIFSIPDIDEKIDQIFIDNLNGPNISLDNLAKLGIKNILENEQLVKKNEEFKKALKAYYNSYTDNLIFIENYLAKIMNYFGENTEYVDIIMNKAFEIIYKEESNKKTKNETKENLKAFNQIKKEIFTNSYITSNTIDIVSLIINDIIIEKKLRGTIMKVIDALESDNFLTTLLTLNQKKINKTFLNQKHLCSLMENYLNSAKITDIQKKATFQSQYLAPGFLPFYKIISNFINKNISQEFFRNEKKFRDINSGNITKSKRNFHTEESRFLDLINKEIITDESDYYKFFNEEIKKFPSDFLLSDYINFFLNKYSENIYTMEELGEIECEKLSIQTDEEEEEEDNRAEYIDNFYVEIIKIIINLRFTKDINIIKDNENNEANQFLFKIMWLESNKNYIFTIIQLFSEAYIKIYRNKKNKLLFKQINELIEKKKIKYITDEKRNPEHTTEVNECYYIIMGSLYLAITDFETIILYDPKNNRDYVEEEENQITVKIDKYYECLQNIVKVSQPFNDMLYLFSNELYIIVDLTAIINLLKMQKNEYINIKVIEKITKNLRDNIDIIRESKFGKVNELKNNLDVLINLISDNVPNKDKEYYTLIRNILVQEIMKVKDKNYRFDIFKSYIINEKEIILNLNMILSLLLKGFIISTKDKMLNSIENFESRKDEILIFIENKIKDKKNEYLSQIFLYYFEKISHIFIDNYFKTKNKNEKNFLEKEPLTVFSKCLELLIKISSSKSEIKNMSKLLYIGYIRVFIFKFEEYMRDNSENLKEPKLVINSINKFKNPISYVVELFYYKVIYNKNNKDIDVFNSKKIKSNLELLNNFQDLFNSIKNSDNSNEEIENKENNFIDLLNEKVIKLNNSKDQYPFKEYFYYSDYIDEKYLKSILNDECQKDYPVLAKYLDLKINDNNKVQINDFYKFNKVLCGLNEEYSSKITREYAKNETLEKQLIYKENKELFNEFFDIFNKYQDNNDNEINDNENNDNEINDNEINDNEINGNVNNNESNEDNKIENNSDKNNNNDENNNKLNPRLPLLKFFIVDDNDISEKYKDIYGQFIEKHNKIVEELFKAKSKNLNIKNEINIKNIYKEDEIFNTNNEFLDTKELFNYSYRKVILNDDYSQFNKFEINLPFIEEVMTDKLLKNKKLISKDIFEFKYKNEDLEFKDKDICTTFREKIYEQELSIKDKIIIYQYYDENKGNANLHMRLLDDFSYLIIYSCENLNKIGKPSQTKIIDLIKEKELVSKDFLHIFEEKENEKDIRSLSDDIIDKKNLTLDKLVNIYEYYQILCFNKVKEKLSRFQEEMTDNEQKKINDYIKDNLNINEENKKALEIALRKFILCFLSKEKNPEYKIKNNINNIKNYLEIKDLWDKSFYQKNGFSLLKKLKELGIKVNNIIPFYDRCFKGFHKNYFDDVKLELKNREEEKKMREKEKEKEDISNFNANDDVDIEDNKEEKEEDDDNDDDDGSYYNEDNDEESNDETDRY